MSRVYNFSAGPAVLPEEVLKEAADEMLDYQGSGQSVMEMSHRSKVYDKIIKDAEAEKTVEFEKVLLVDNNGAVTVGTPIVDGAKVVCEVVTPLVKGDKVLVFHKKRKKGYKKLNGHRQQFTELTIKQVIA